MNSSRIDHIARPASAIRQTRRDGKCPICGKPTVAQFRPFCSQRCARIDLGRWLKGNYRIPAEKVPGTERGEEDGGAEDEVPG